MAGTSETYTIVVSNVGASDASNLNVDDSLPAQGLTNVSSPGLPAGVTFNAGADTWSLASLAPGHSVTLELSGTVPSGATGSTYVNTTTASASDAGTVTAIDTETLNSQSSLSITMTDGVTSVIAGTPETYTVVVSDGGPSDARNLSVVDTLPLQGLTNLSSPGLPAGVTFNPGTVTWSLLSLPAGHSVTLELSGTVPSGATGTTYVNTTTSSASDAAAVSSSDGDSLGHQADITLTNTDNDGGSSVTGTAGAAVPGTSITYTVTATNFGPSNLTGGELFDPMAEIGSFGSDSWTATDTGGAAGFSPSGSGDIDDIVSVPSGASITYTVVATIRSGATGNLWSSASITPQLGLTNTNPLAMGATVYATDTDTLAQTSLTITDSDGVTSVAAGSAVTYTIVVSNAGTSMALSPSVTDTLPSQGLINPSSPDLPAGATFSTGSGNDSWTLASLPPGQSVTVDLTGTVPPGATGSSYTYTATASAWDASAVSASDTDSVERQGDVTVTLTDSGGGSSVSGAVGTAQPGSSVTYTLVAANAGPSTISGAELYNPASEIQGISSDSWTAIGTAGTAGFSPQGTGDIDDIVVIPPGGSISYTVVASISSSASGSLWNSASLTSPTGFTNTNPLATFGTVFVTDRDTVTSS